MAAPNETRSGNRRIASGERILFSQFLKDRGVVYPRRGIDELSRKVIPHPALVTISRGNVRHYVYPSSPDAERLATEIQTLLSNQADQQLRGKAESYYRSGGVPEEDIPGLIERVLGSERDHDEASLHFGRRALRGTLFSYRQERKREATSEFWRQRAHTYEARDEKRQQEERRLLGKINRTAFFRLSGNQRWLLQQVLIGRRIGEIAKDDPLRRKDDALRQAISRAFKAIAPEKSKSQGGRPRNYERTPLLKPIPSPRPSDPQSYLSYWRDGYLSTRDLERLSPTLQSFLKEQALRTHNANYILIWAYFVHIDGVFFLPSDRHAFIVDREIMERHIGELQALVKALGERTLPPRNKTERRYFREKILRMPSAQDETLQPITEDAARRYLFSYAENVFFAIYHFGRDSYSLAKLAITRAQPDLEGRRGNFNNIEHYQKSVFADIIRSVAMDRFRQKPPAIAERTNRNENQNTLYQRQLKDLQPEDLQPKLSHLNEKLQMPKIVELRSHNIDWGTIARIVLGNDTRRNRATVRKRYSRFRREVVKEKSPMLRPTIA